MGRKGKMHLQFDAEVRRLFSFPDSLSLLLWTLLPFSGVVLPRSVLKGRYHKWKTSPDIRSIF